MRSATREAIQTISLAVFLVLIIQTAVQNYRVDGPSMDPTLANEDRVIVSKVVYTEIDAQRVARFVPGFDADDGEIWRPFNGPSRGDVIVFKWPIDPDQTFVKRIVGMPGDVIRIELGSVFVNGELQDEEFVLHGSRETRPDHVVGADNARCGNAICYYVLGDNRLESDDSRQWGDVSQENIIGKVWVSYWPLGRFSALFSRLP